MNQFARRGIESVEGDGKFAIVADPAKENVVGIGTFDQHGADSAPVIAGEVSVVGELPKLKRRAFFDGFLGPWHQVRRKDRIRFVPSRDGMFHPGGQPVNAEQNEDDRK